MQAVLIASGCNIKLKIHFVNGFPGNPLPEIRWLKDGQVLVVDSHHQVLSHGRFLQIFGTQVADTGRYSCLASNSAGERSRHYNLNVLGTETVLYSGRVVILWMSLKVLSLLVPVSPTIAGSGPDGLAEEVTVTLSSPTSLLCEAQSYPPALITWLRDGSPFESSHNVRVLPGLTPGITIKMNTVVNEAHGCYLCFHRWENAADSQCEGRGCWEVHLCGHQ